MPKERVYGEHEQGTALDKDDNVFDVTEWRKGMKQTRNGEDHVRAYDKTNNAIFQELLEEMKALHHTIKQIHNIEV